MLPTLRLARTPTRTDRSATAGLARRLAAAALLLILCPQGGGAQEPRKENARPGPTEPQPSDTSHIGQAVMVNQWGLDFNQVTLRHRRGNDASGQETMTWYNLLVGATSSPPLVFWYETGVGSPRDYWWVTFTVKGSNQAWCIKDNFYCSLTADDDGHVTMTLNGDTQTMVVTFSSSSSCTVPVKQC